MKHPILGIDISILSEDILSNDPDPSGRKPMYCIVTGMGKGKTRLLVEINKYMNENYGLSLDNKNKSLKQVISIPITFNSQWEETIHPTNNIKFNYAISIVARIISIYYRIPLRQVHGTIRKLVKDMLVDEDNNVTCFIQDCIRFIVNQANVNNNKIVTHFILLVDESKEAEKVFGNQIHEILRRSLLNDQLIDDSRCPLIVELIMSSLTVDAAGASYSKRPIKPLTTPESFDPQEVIDV
jgi:hypothetical protein